MLYENRILGIEEMLQKLRDCDFEFTQDEENVKASMLQYAKAMGAMLKIQSQKIDSSEIWYILDIIATMHELIAYEKYEDVEWVHEMIKEVYNEMLY